MVRISLSRPAGGRRGGRGRGLACLPPKVLRSQPPGARADTSREWSGPEPGVRGGGRRCSTASLCGGGEPGPAALLAGVRARGGVALRAQPGGAAAGRQPALRTAGAIFPASQTAKTRT